MAYLLHRERMHDLRAIVGQLGSFLGRNDRDEARGEDFAWICGENTVDLLPDLQLSSIQTSREEGGREIGVASADLTKEGSWHRCEETCRIKVSDRHGCTVEI